ncbi:MAG: hypothetical protein U9N53_13215 [Bacteroidota bacterium]|nr:hypothetical protein [Bacteroidota bacterium]
MGTSQLLSVPYAIHFKAVELINESDPEFNVSLAKTISVGDTTHGGTLFSEDFNDLKNKPDSIKDSQ